VYPYLLVSIDSGVSTVKVSGDGSFELGQGPLWEMIPMNEKNSEFFPCCVLTCDHALCSGLGSVPLPAGEHRVRRQYAEGLG